MANAKGLQAEKAGERRSWMWRTSAQNAKGWWGGRDGCVQGGSGDAAGRAIWVWRLASAAARLVLFGGGRGNEPLVSDAVGAVLVVRWPAVGRRGTPRQRRRRAGGRTVRCRSPGAAGRPCARRLWRAAPARRAEGACPPRRIGVGWASGGQAGGAVAACSPYSCSPCENREVTPDGHTCPIDFEAAETVDYKSSLSKAP